MFCKSPGNDSSKTSILWFANRGVRTLWVTRRTFDELQQPHHRKHGIPPHLQSKNAHQNYLITPTTDFALLTFDMSATGNAVKFVIQATKNNVGLRYDPLTKHQTRVNPARAKRPKQGESIGDDSLQKAIANSTGPGCVFCPENILQKVPKFQNLGEQERITVGSTIVFPNLNPFGQGHAVAVIAQDHYLSPKQFTSPIIADAIKAAIQYFELAAKAEGGIGWPSLVWNYLPPSAGSILHPHMQMMLEDEAVPAVAQLEQLAKEYYEQHGSNYWTDLTAAEKGGPRWIGHQNAVDVMVSFAPRGTNELLLIVPGCCTLTELNDAKRASLSNVINQILTIYETNLSVGSFNMVSYSMPVGSTSDENPHFTLHFKLFSRPKPAGLYTNDTGPLERMLDSWVIDSVPETVAELVKAAWP